MQTFKIYKPEHRCLYGLKPGTDAITEVGPTIHYSGMKYGHKV